MAGKNWQIEDKWVEYCSCDHGCPCETMAEPTYGYCTGLVAFKIDKGWCEDVRLDDLAVAGTVYLPRALHHGQGVSSRSSTSAPMRHSAKPCSTFSPARTSRSARYSKSSPRASRRPRTRCLPRSTSNGISRNGGRVSRFPA